MLLNSGAYEMKILLFTIPLLQAIQEATSSTSKFAWSQAPFNLYVVKRRYRGIKNQACTLD